MMSLLSISFNRVVTSWGWEGGEVRSTGGGGQGGKAEQGQGGAMYT
jgi:hypothetical protein